ncbi:MAG: response regulator [SAR324 cluster bacterium]|jgi:DNA-binding response OmpR family regulator|nr:response regulator [SAR324 cluster bacterium]MDP6331545.1 response regulator [SAR324 cluster bacterium]MDP6886852.1 response regulator [SAR324 cluster bacterium]|tara:strand:+ start:3549 stop:4436 length:888 start_codon:yes stop_codon:yes gene_type:complete
MNLLIADDTAEVLNFLQDFFVKAGHSVFCARDGEEALKILQNEEIDGIFCALTMPKLGGLELLKEVQSANSRRPLVILCPPNDSENALNALQLGACDYLLKAINPLELQRTLDRVVSLQEGFHFSAYAMDHLLQETRTLEIGNDFTGLNRIIAFMTQDLPSYGILNQEQLFRMNMLLKEAIENAIFHGNLELRSEMRRENPELFYKTAAQKRDIDPYKDRKLILQYDISRNSAKYVVRDEGKGFVHADLLDPADPDNLLRIEGRGLIMIMNFMDEVFWNDRGNEVTMVRYRKRKT